MKQLTESNKRMRAYLVISVFILFSIFLVGMFWLSTTPVTTVTLSLAYLAGLSMIVLPCTLPLVFIIVPLCMGKDYKKGLGMALLFGIGMIITLTLYGVVLALLGQSLGLMKVVQYMFLLAGGLALIFGLSELRLIKFELPAYRRMPGFIQHQPDLAKAFFLGLFLGNAGVACPNPATYVIFAYIAAMGNVALGASLQFVNGIGRFIPLLMLTILGILGVNAIQGLLKRKDTINKATGFGLIVLAGFIIVWGLFGHLWFLNTPLHGGWTRSFYAAGGAQVAEMECCIEPPCEMCARGEWIFEKGTCLCRIHLEQGHIDKVCPECRKGIAEGRGIFDIARRTQWPAFGIMTAIILIPTIWYLRKRPFKKVEEMKKSKTKGGKI